jgi:hypothetical protein
MSTYYLFGSDVVDVYKLNYLPDVIAYLLKRNAGMMYGFTTDNHPSELISAYDGWDNWVEITEKHFNEIRKSYER